MVQATMNTDQASKKKPADRFPFLFTRIDATMSKMEEAAQKLMRL
jgi:hypothetical protein